MTSTAPRSPHGVGRAGRLPRRVGRQGGAAAVEHVVQRGLLVVAEPADHPGLDVGDARGVLGQERAAGGGEADQQPPPVGRVRGLEISSRRSSLVTRSFMVWAVTNEFRMLGLS